MKKITHIILAMLLGMVSCTEDVLDKKPLDVISDADVWTDEVLMDAYLTNVYVSMYVLLNETPYTSVAGSDALEWQHGRTWNGAFIINELSDEGTRNWLHGQSQAKYEGITVDGGVLEWWEHAYKANRILNEFIERVPESPASDEYKNVRIAEARILRAFNYFFMVKRYGGVPLITKTQEITETDEELYRSRNKEQEVYDFIISEIDDVVNDLPERAETDAGRPSKYAALALKSRAALYAASIAKYGTVKLDGIVGIPSSLAQDYFQKAYDAANTIINSGLYALYDSDEDKVENFKNIFLVDDNIETIWAEIHDYSDWSQGGNGWGWDFWQCPKPHAWNAGNQNAPYLEMVEEYEYIDGSPGTLDRELIQQGLWDMDELWENKDPRFFATIYSNKTPWKEGTVEWHRGLILPDGSTINSGAYEGVSATGNQIVDGSFGTGFGVMKYLEESKDNMGARNTSGTDWQHFRYAEILLNFAEAAFELGKTGDALNAINQIRDRAGITTLNSVDMEKIKHERKVELAFEGHRYWDLRRWRTAVDELTINRSGMSFLLDYTTGKYKLEVIENYDGITAPLFFEKNYYLPITVVRRGNNSNLLENPGYE